jgi:hypothetical protein
MNRSKSSSNQKSEALPPPASEPFSFSKFLNRPSVDQSKSGLTARVAKILESDDRPVGPVTQGEREHWYKQRMQLQDEVQILRKELRLLKADHSQWVDEEPDRANRQDLPPSIERFPERPPPPDSVGTELELLRRENYDLRNMTKEERQSKAKEIMIQLKAEIDALRTDNKKLTDQVELLLRSRNSSALDKPPTDIIATLRPFPFEISDTDREMVYRITEAEWKSDYIMSRHGNAEPLKDPFQRRRP